MAEEERGAGDPTDYVTAVNVTKGGMVVAERVMWAVTSKERRRGLLGRQGLEPEEGM